MGTEVDWTTEEGQQQFWKTYWNEVYGICYHILRDRVRANDIAVDIMTDFLFEYSQRLDHPGATQSYLRLMAVRRSSRQRQRMSECDSLDEHSAGLPHIDDSESSHARIMVPRLENCLGELSDKAQQALRLRFREDLPFENIGCLLGGSKQYINRLVHQSLVSLKDCLERRKTQTEEGARA